MRRRNDGAGASPQEEFGDVCFHALGIIDQNREYLQMHLLASADLPTRQALSDIQIESARLDRTVRNAITLYQLERRAERAAASGPVRSAGKGGPSGPGHPAVAGNNADDGERGHRALRRHGRPR